MFGLRETCRRPVIARTESRACCSASGMMTPTPGRERESFEVLVVCSQQIDAKLCVVRRHLRTCVQLQTCIGRLVEEEIS